MHVYNDEVSAVTAFGKERCHTPAEVGSSELVFQ